MLENMYEAYRVSHSELVNGYFVPFLGKTLGIILPHFFIPN